MELPQDFSPADLDRIRVNNQNGLTVGRVGLSMTLYVKGPWETEQRRAFATAIDAHLQRVGDRMRWAILPPPVGAQRYASVAPLRIADHAAAQPLDGTLSFEAHSGEGMEEAGHFSIAVSFPNPRRRRLGFVTLTLPVSWLNDAGPGAFQDMVVEWCAAVQPFHGGAGLALIHSPNYAETRVAEPHLFPLIQRFPGLEYDVPVDHARLCGDGIKSVNWLTVVSDSLLGRIGGRASLARALTPAATLFDYPGGVVIQAGPAPLLGDNERNDVPKAYQAVAAVLKPLRADYPDGVIATPRGLDSKEFGRRWLARFE